MIEETATYGLVPRSRKAAACSASELSQVITGLESHHAQEAHAFAENAGSLTRAINSDPDAIFADGQLYSWHNMRIEGIASELRSDRDTILQHLLALRAPLADILVEAQSLLPENAMFSADVEPGALETPPKPIAGIELTLSDRLRILLDTLGWTQRVARSLALHAIGPCYALFVLIEHPSAAATDLHGKLDEVRTELVSFILRDHKPR